MTLSAPVVVAIAFFAPMLVLVVIGRIKMYRRRVASLAAEQPSLLQRTNGESARRAGILFDPPAEVTPNVLMRRFTLPQRTYLRQQHVLALTCSVLFAYILFVLASTGLLPEHIQMYASGGPSQRIWKSYLDVITATGHLSLAFAFLSGLLAVSYLKTPASAVFLRTRPLSRKFLFWGRISFAFASLQTGTLTGIIASILLLFVVYGPVWRVAYGPPASVFRLGLSMLTTTALAFSITVFCSCLSRRDRLRGRLKFLPVLLGAMVGLNAIRVSHFPLATRVPEILFLFPAQASTGPLAFALVPILCAVALLWIAQHLSTHFEI